MLNLTPDNQIKVLEIKVIEIKLDPTYSEKDRKQMEQYYKKKISALKTKQ